MAQKTKNITIGNRSFTMKELPMRVIYDLIDNKDSKWKSMGGMRELLTISCPELTGEALLDLYPSEIQDLWKTFEEVNSAFLGVVKRIGLIDALITGLKPVLEAELKKAMQGAMLEMQKPSPAASVSLSNMGTDQQCGITDTAFS